MRPSGRISILRVGRSHEARGLCDGLASAGAGFAAAALRRARNILVTVKQFPKRIETSAQSLKNSKIGI